MDKKGTSAEWSTTELDLVGSDQQPQCRSTGCIVLLVLGGTICFAVCVAIVILTATKGTAESANSTDIHGIITALAGNNSHPGISYGVVDITNSTDIIEDPVSHILTQVEELESLGCHPTAVKVPVRDEVGDDIDKMSVYPRWVLTSRCVEECSFCRDDHELCLPAPGATILKAFALAYQGPNNVTQFRQLSVVQHTSCQCQQQ